MTISRRTLAFVMDPLGSIDVAADTTYVLIEEALRRGHRVLYLDPADLALSDGRPIARARALTQIRPQPGNPAELGPEQTVVLDDEVDVVLQRQDPPVDAEYVTTTQILGLCRQALVLNRPAGILAANEKLYACGFPELMAETLVSRHMAELIDFMAKLGGEMIVKPLAGKGGEGIFHLHHGDRNLFSMLEQSTAFETRRVMAQRYLPGVRKGDKRILLLEGEPIGAVLRVPREHETRSNLHVGGRPQRTSLDEDDRRIIDALAPSLRRDGLFFVGIDVIAGRLTEVNVTSPTGVREINALEGTRLEARILDGVERLLDEQRVAGRNFPP